MTATIDQVEDLEEGFQPRWFMAQWFSPTLLYRIARRRKASLEQPTPVAVLGASVPTRDYSTTKAIGIDYVADLGDAIHPTLSVARALAVDELHCDPPRPETPAGEEAPVVEPLTRPVRKPLPRGDVLVMGGDEVYPYPDDNSYLYQTLMPYAWAAFLESGPQVLAGTATGADSASEPDTSNGYDLWALPGNHDYYDTKHRFDEWFREDHTVGMAPNPWTVRKRGTTYFALQLPHGWWLLGVDTYRTGAVDVDQFAYFAGLPWAKGDRAIVCWSKPVWVDASDDATAVANLDAFLDDLAQRAGGSSGPDGRRAFAPLLISGDIHCYARYEDPARAQQRFVCGGGGAFLHPTHLLPSSTDGTMRRSVFPSVEASRKMATGVAPRFLFQNPHFLQIPLVVGALGAGATSLSRWGGVATVCLTAAALAAFSKVGRPRRTAGLVLGAAFGAAMGGAVVGLAVTSRWLLGEIPAVSEGQLRSMLAIAATAMVCAPVVSVLMGGYLAVASRVPGTHRNESFAAMQIEDHKSFLRLRVCRDGALSIWPVAIDQVGTWRWRTGVRRFFTAIRPSTPHLIEAPLTYSPNDGTWSGGTNDEPATEG